MKVYIPIFVLILLVVGTAGCILVENGNENITKNYTGYNISFNYTGDYHLSVEPEDANGDISIFLSKGGPLNTSQLQITITPNIYRTEELAIDNHREMNYLGLSKISNNTTIINDRRAYEDVFQGNLYGEEIYLHQILMVKNDNIYTIIYQAPKNEFDKEKRKFDVVLESFRVHNTG